MTGSTCGVCGTPVSTFGVADSATGQQLAGWWRRVGATFADNVILYLPSLLIQSFFTATSGATIGILAFAALQGVYLVKLIAARRGQTIGNRVALTRVRDAATGQGVTMVQALKRWAFVAAYQLLILLVAGQYAVVVLLLVIAIDDLMPLFDRRKQTLHDKFAGTIVVMA